MKIYNIVLAVILVAGCNVPASAQSLSYPGSFWTTNGNLSPAEKGNMISLSHAEQGISFRGAELFGALTFQADTKKFDWNRRYTGGGGLRFTQNVGSGMIRAGVQYLHERRYNHTTTYQGLVYSVDSWFGWGSTRGGK